MKKTSRIITIILAVLTAGTLLYTLPTLTFAEELADETIQTIETEEINEDILTAYGEDVVVAETPVATAYTVEEAAALTGDEEVLEEIDVNTASEFATKRLMLFAEATDSIQAYGAAEAVYFDGYYLLTYNTVEETENAYNELLNVYGEYAVIPDMAVTLESYGWGTEYMHLDTETKAAANGSEVTVAVLDSGINKNHPIFDGTTILDGFNAINGTTDVTDNEGHGTAVAGIIAESTPANVKILPVKVAESLTNGSTFKILYNAVKYAQEKGAQVINMSLGGPASGKAAFNVMQNKFAEFNVTMVCASGNNGEDEDAVYQFPSAFDCTISVGAIDKTGARCSFSNYGASLDFVAPGQAVNAAYVPSSSEYSYTASVKGTSFATPYVTAAAALVYAEHPGYTKEDVYTELVNHSQDLGEAGKDAYYGYGYLRFDEHAAPAAEVTALSLNTENNIEETAAPEVQQTEAPVAQTTEVKAVNKTEAKVTAPKGTKISKVKPIKKGFTVKWKKQRKDTNGYQIQISTNKSFTKIVKTVNIKSSGKTSTTIKKLGGKKKYFVRIRTFKKVGNEKIYSNWSGAKTVKTK